MRSKSLTLSLAIALLCVVASRLPAGTPALYSRSELETAARLYSANLRGLWKEDLLGRLKPSEFRTAATISLELPIEGSLLGFYAESISRVVVIPISAIKFIDDLATAYAWRTERGCDPAAVLDYVGMLRYRQSMPPPLVALAVPRNALQDERIKEASGQDLKSAVYFLMAHELGHVLRNDPGNAEVTAAESQRNEIGADAFALDLMRRISVFPTGMLLVLTAAYRLEPAPGDPMPAADYDAYRRSKATHPLSTTRLSALAAALRMNLDSFARGQADPAAWRAPLASAADTIDDLAHGFEDRKLRAQLRDNALTQDLKRLAECR